MMARIIIRMNMRALVVIILLLATISCEKASPMQSITEIIETTEKKLYDAPSIEIMQELQSNLLDSITACLDVKHGGYRFSEGNEEYNNIMKRLDRYNIIYCRAISRFNPDLNTETGKKDKVIRLLAIMKKMEHQTLTAPHGFNSEGFNDSPVIDDRSSKTNIDEQNVFPTQEEIMKANAQLPIQVSEGTLNTKIEYNEKTKTQTFYYRFTQEVDESLITREVIDQLKSNMVSALKNDENNVKRLNAGMTFLYDYYSVENKRLYEIKINSNDIK